MKPVDVPAKYRLDRGAFEVVSITDPPKDRSYWMSRTPAERFEALELLRRLAYGYDPDTARLQRVLEVTELKIR
jgi:hypothetical protein